MKTWKQCTNGDAAKWIPKEKCNNYIHILHMAAGWDLQVQHFCQTMEQAKLLLKSECSNSYTAILVVAVCHCKYSCWSWQMLKAYTYRSSSQGPCQILVCAMFMHSDISLGYMAWHNIKEASSVIIKASKGTNYTHYQLRGVHGTQCQIYTVEYLVREFV